MLKVSVHPTIDEMFGPSRHIRNVNFNLQFLNHRDLAARGWTKSMIVSFLSVDKTVPNPHNRYGSPMQLYRLDHVLTAERHPEFLARRKRAVSRSLLARQSIDWQREELLQKVNSIEIKIPQFTKADLITTACRRNNEYWESRNIWDRRVTPFDDQKLIDRICVNFLFYECGMFRKHADAFVGSVGAEDARLRIAQKIFEIISAQFSYLIPECRRQLLVRVENAEAKDSRAVVALL